MGIFRVSGTGKSRSAWYCCWLWLLLPASFRAGAQQQRFWSAAVLSRPVDTVAVKALLARADTLKQTDPHGGERLCLEAAALSRSIGFERGVILSYVKAAGHASQRGSYDTSLNYYLQTLPYVEMPQHYLRYAAIVYNSAGVCCIQMGRLEQSLNYYSKALDALGKGSRTNKTTDSAGIYGNIGSLWHRLKEYDEAYEYFTIARRLAERDRDTVRMITCYYNLGALYTEQSNWPSAAAWYEKGLRLLRLKMHPSTAIFTYGSLAMIAAEKKEYARAFRYIDSARSVPGLPQQRSHSTLQTVDVALATVYMEIGQHQKAVPLLVAVHDDAVRLSNRDMVRMIGSRLAEACAHTGDHRRAYEYLLQHSALGDSVANKEKGRFFSLYLNARMAEKDKAMLEQQLFIARQKSNLQQQNYLIAAVGAGALLLLGLSLLQLRNFRQKQAIQQARLAQLEQQQEINMLKAKISGEQEERTRIGRELHDNIASQLWAIKLNVDSLQQSEESWALQQKKLGAIHRQLADASQDIRKTAHNLMPDLLLEEGLATALAATCQKTRQHTGLEVDFQEYGMVPPLNKEIELSIYRMVQELIQNVLKHARNANFMLVQLSCAGTLLNITVEDNGEGFTTRRDEGIGLQQIRKRTAALRGHFDLQTVPGRGTTAYLEFDLQYLR